MLKSARKKPKDPEGRMPLVDHLRELRNRLVKSLLAFIPLMSVALFFSKDIAEFLTLPVPRCVSELEPAARAGKCAVLSQIGITSPFTTYVKVGIMAGLVVSAPVWLYQLWAFIAPGLHKSEKKYAVSTVVIGTPLFLAGSYLAYWILPHAVPLLLSFSVEDSVNYITVDDMIGMTVKLVLAFGLAFQLPLLLILLNMGGVVSGARMLGWWRGMVMGIAIFAAIVTPTDPLSMIALQVPLTALYFAAVGFALLNDRRRRRQQGPELDDDEASRLDLTPEPIAPVEPVTAPAALPEQAGGGAGTAPARHAGSYDDVT
ncbi:MULTISPECIES: twin-arginine translocase subunit TatC [Streptomyces]|uniref:Sec-independent protein translocase protein TatC n=1 Tax=Streptomyces sudanensis TaxID=436397 RepID=A0ABY4TG98_9ACTN|nr:MULTISPECIES: twin-arginine translocase subunit TatC [Streptomyces]MCP9959608.1 twin-arginine translocase subunit TatC [Streptomyces sudanensis]MCP9988666.1 twin-arginine translocase subunit TatC [Streptomyces sudanensis]MCP9999957.1 twin-arginine translocase subunit TatC [Streptomyces sudanensis]URN17940.1 twin-arginine translocase subunit TatC [Streptomyces sudanensis]